MFLVRHRTFLAASKSCLGELGRFLSWFHTFRIPRALPCMSGRTGNSWLILAMLSRPVKQAASGRYRTNDWAGAGTSVKPASWESWVRPIQREFFIFLLHTNFYYLSRMFLLLFFFLVSSILGKALTAARVQKWLLALEEPVFISWAQTSFFLNAWRIA